MRCSYMCAAPACALLLRAVVLDPSRDDMLTFQLDPKKHSVLYITSHLWDLMQ